MGVLDSVLAYKAQKDAQARADIDAIPLGIKAFTDARQTAIDNNNKSLLMQIEAGKSGYQIKNGQLSIDKQSPVYQKSVLEQLQKSQELKLNEQKTMGGLGYNQTNKSSLLQENPQDRMSLLKGRQTGVVTGKTYVKDPSLGKQVATGDVDESGNPIYKTVAQANYNKSVDDKTNKQFENLSHTLDYTQGVRTAYATTALGVHRGERITGLVSAYADHNLTQQESEELAIGLNSMLQGSNQSAQEQVRGLIPKSIIGDTNKMKEYLFNTPIGLDQKKIVERMVNDVNRETDVMKMQLLRDAKPKIAAYEHLAKKDPQRWSDVLNSWGISPEAYQQWKESGFKSDIDFSKIGKGGEQSSKSSQSYSVVPEGTKGTYQGKSVVRKGGKWQLA